jgi:prevent-host-death family protein
MDAVSLTDAKARLSALVDRAQAGENINITRRGRPVAGLTAAARPREAVDLVMLEALTVTMSGRDDGALDVVRGDA